MQTPIKRQPSEVEAELKLAFQETGLDPSFLESVFRVLDSSVTVEKLTQWFVSTRALRSQLFKQKSKLLISSEPSNSTSQDSSLAESSQDRLRKAQGININSKYLSWKKLVCLHSTQHEDSSEKEETPSSLEVNVNSGGIVYFAVFQQENGEEGAACLKFTPSRLTTQSERLGYEIARHLGVVTPQARLVRNESSEWTEIIQATENVKSKNNEDPECVKICEELLEALELNRCLLLMGYIDGRPLHKYKPDSMTPAIAQRISASLGRILLLDLVLRNEDRFPCQQLGWRGNTGNLLCTEKTPIFDPLDTKQVDLKLSKVPPIPKTGKLVKPKSLPSQATEITGGRKVLTLPAGQSLITPGKVVHVVAIDSGVPRRPPGHKREFDKSNIPRFVEMLVNDPDTASEVLTEVSAGYFDRDDFHLDLSKLSLTFISGFKGGFKEMLGLKTFMLKLHRRLDYYLKQFVEDITENIPADWTPEKSSPGSTSSSPSSVSPQSRLGRRFTLQLKDFNKLAKVDDGIHERVEHWDDVLASEGNKLCKTHGFITGFLEGYGPHNVVDSYELKIRLEHILERVDLIIQGGDTDRPSRVLDNVYVGGYLCGKSVHILKHIGITHILCLCPIEVGPPDADILQSFQYKSCQVLDIEEEDIARYFNEACEFIESCERSSGKALVHCFEGKSRSPTIVLAYLMLNKKYTLLDAWNILKAAHARSQPNDAFMKALGELEKKLYGNNTMDWQQKKPALIHCPICQKSVGLSNSSLLHHMNRFHHIVEKM